MRVAELYSGVQSMRVAVNYNRRVCSVRVSRVRVSRRTVRRSASERVREIARVRINKDDEAQERQVSRAHARASGGSRRYQAGD